MAEAKAFAGLNPKGEIIVRSISDTELAVMVNLLVTTDTYLPKRGDPDTQIQHVFHLYLSGRGYKIVPVTVAVVS